jgi:sortase (surface protein transpeptidase)
MANGTLDNVVTEVDNIKVGDSFLVEDPEALLQYKIDGERAIKVIVQNIRSIHKNF